MDRYMNSDDDECVTDHNSASQDKNDSESEWDNTAHFVLNSVFDQKRARGRPYAETFQNYEPKGKRQRKDRMDVKQLIAISCCSLLCLSVIPMDIIQDVQTKIAELNQNELSQWVLDWLWSHASADSTGSGNTHFQFFIHGWSVCLTSWLAVIGLPLSTIRKRFLNGEKSVPVPGNKEGRTGIATQFSLVWLSNFADRHGEKQPDSSNINLPSCLTKQQIYQQMKDEQTGYGNPVDSEEYFFQLWRETRSHIKIPKNSRLSNCSFCTKIKLQLAECRDIQYRKFLSSMRSEHLKKQSNERLKYYSHISKAKKFPNKYMSIIIDGMDQSKTDIPHYMFVSSMSSSFWKLRTHLTGAIIHGVGIYGFFDYLQYPHSSNLSIHVLLNLLYLCRDSLPDILYLQMDNCGRENKNKYVFAFLSLLIEKKVFKKIKISFLIVGHTHEDIDQVFSRFSIWLRNHSALTLPKLMDGFQKCTTPLPTSILAEQVKKFSEWLSPSINNMQGHSKPHCFKFVADDTGRAVLYWKYYANDKEWNLCAGNERYVLKKIPEGQPENVKPCYDKINVAKLKEDVKKTFEYFHTLEDVSWWDDFYKNVDNDAGEEEEGQHIHKLDEILKAKLQSERLPQATQDEVYNQNHLDPKESCSVILGKIVRKKTK